MSPKVFDESKMRSSQYFDQDILAQAKPWYVLFTLALALVLNFIPLQSLALTLRPDFVALVILYWCVNQPQRLGMILAFCVGLMMDVHHSGVLGHYAMVYCIIVYIASVFRRRLRIFSLMKQAPQIGLILIAMQSIQILIALISGANFPGWIFYLASFTGALLWPIMAYTLNLPLKSGNEPDRL